MAQTFMPIYSIMVCAIYYIMPTEVLILQQFVKLSLEVALCYGTNVLANFSLASICKILK